ncbi:GNAT family N-acetyltransferase [Allomuricauda sp. F6463D]|uniref:GNAT family N-acetyltransferase n=1 Tax=Allomuricauda sp. F6463D TaxID=2926409 RepID=UPI001FF5C71A|nr:GNAT family N-acetyltransferase [Muricauda sp. F6463D]MCK0161136.1 GNAT family N-acetyltransferase [Muricauda sp. F6463D]
MPLSSRECVASDLNTLVQISKETFVTAFEKDNDPNDFRAYIQEAFAPSKLRVDLASKDSFFYFVYDQETLVGYFKLNRGTAQTDVCDSNALEIERIYVLSSHQGKKIGSWMLQQIIEKSNTLGMAYIWLGVWEKNIDAIKFYQKNGFAKFGEHPYYIGADKQTDWLLRLEL